MLLLVSYSDSSSKTLPLRCLLKCKVDFLHAFLSSVIFAGEVIA